MYKYFFALFVIVLPALSFANDLNREFKSVQELNGSTEVGIAKVPAYVAHIYECHCPDGMMCKPCMNINIIISDSPEKIENYTLMDSKSLILYVGDSSPFEKGKRYLFEMDLAEKSHPRLINFKLIQ